VKIGTPEEDCLYRDLTINSLFYNINTGQVEDWCGMVIEDLNNRYIRTPIAPESTFSDDPLRMLRALRFCVRMNFKLSEAVTAAIHRDNLKVLLKAIAPERIGKELQSMLKADNLEQVFEYIVEFGLMDYIFACPDGIEIKPTDKENCIIYVKLFLRLMHSISVSLPPEQMRMFTLSAFLIPYATYLYHKNQKELLVIHYILADSLKLTTIEINTSVTLLTKISKWKPIFEQYKIAFDRKTVGLLLIETKELWLASMTIAFLEDAVTTKKELPHLISDWNTLNGLIHSHNLIDVWKAKLFFNGKEIMALLNIPRGGKEVGDMKDQLLYWHLLHPDGTREECQQWLLNTFSK